MLTERKVHQLHFTSWPDHGVPTTVFPLLSFLKYVSEIPTTGPIVVHCSAGVGRSGSFMLIDSMRRHLLVSDSLNIEAHLRHIRQQRAKLVQTLEQYIFCHEAIRQLIAHGSTRIHVDNFVHYTHYLFHEVVDGRTRLQIQYEANDVCKCPHSPTCPNPIGYEIFPGYHREAEFIVATWPTESETFWELIWEKNCQTVVVLGGESEFWRGIENAGELRIQRNGDDTTIISSNEDQASKRCQFVEFMTHRNYNKYMLCVRTLAVSQCDFELDTWTEIERIQQRRLQYHQSPLLVLNTQNNSTAYILCVLTSIACQLEAESCIDVLQLLAAYKHKLCNVWRTQVTLKLHLLICHLVRRRNNIRQAADSGAKPTAFNCLLTGDVKGKRISVVHISIS
ncbi:unnamed protein product [Toxocara canis]|uniref:Protein-tyrosine phosphatase n=1 Tax=Toxocara canis TaxID=6265 RepID=A0A183TZS5_TOXCA|nr:unnamed protein product [Toxocara canis]